MISTLTNQKVVSVLPVLLWFYGISTIVGYLHPVYTFILEI